MACYPVAVDIKRGYVRASGRVTVSMSLPLGAETVVDLENVYIANPDDLTRVLDYLEASIETDENVLVAIFNATDLINAATTNNEITMVARLTEVITPIGETEEFDCLFGTAKFQKTIVGPRGHGGNGGNGGHGGGNH